MIGRPPHDQRRIGLTQVVARTLLTIFLALTSAAVLRAGEAKFTLHLLDHTGKSDTPSRAKRPIKGDTKPLFWIDWCKNWRDIEVSKTLTGVEAERLIAVLRPALVNQEAMHFCGHDPIYGIEFLSPDGEKLKTSLCFTCGTWVQPGKRYDVLVGKRGIDGPLCLELRKVLELPEEVRTKANAEAR